MNFFSISAKQRDVFQYSLLIIVPYLPKRATNAFLVPDNPIFMYRNYDTLRAGSDCDLKSYW